MAANHTGLYLQTFIWNQAINSCKGFRNTPNAPPGMHQIPDRYLQLSEVQSLAFADGHVSLSSESAARITQAHQFLNNKVANSDSLIYGVNTGFGAFCNTRIKPEDLSALQYNLLRSHSCGVGKPVEEDVVRIMLVLKVISLAKGHSGVQLETVQRMLDLLNHNCLPVVFDRGSLGASGDLVPLAHLALPLIGEGEVWLEGERMPSAMALKQLGLKPVTLGAKEGLALINGTQFSLAMLIHAYLNAKQLLQMAHVTAALSVVAYQAKTEPYHPLIQEVRKHDGQMASAGLMMSLLNGSVMDAAASVQDPYSFRCIPQVHGATWKALEHVEAILQDEANAVTDNPLLFPEENEILMGGNFHAQPLALPADYLAMACSELASISERRTYLLLGGKRGLPEFLSANPGLESGLMIPQYAAASLVSLNKQLCSPSSVDSIVSSNGQEDHVSMAANAALKAGMVIDNAMQVLAIELVTASQALELVPRDLGNPLKRVLDAYRELVLPATQDRVMAPEIELATAFLQGFRLGVLI